MDKFEVSREQIKVLVDEMLNEKEEAEVRKNIESALAQATETIDQLAAELEGKNAELSEATESASKRESAIEELTTELEAAREQLKSKDEELASATQKLEDMQKDRAAELRMAELEDAGVVNSDRESQTAKVRGMSDEDFASYKDELVSIRTAVIAELEKAREKVETDAKAEEEAKKAEEKAKEEKSKEKPAANEADDETASEEGDENASEDKEESTPPANISPGQAAMASLNMEYIPSADAVKKYQALGTALAKRMLKNDD